MLGVVYEIYKKGGINMRMRSDTELTKVVNKKVLEPLKDVKNQRPETKPKTVKEIPKYGRPR